MQLKATPWKESSCICDCCGNTSKTIWGEISTPEKSIAVYYLQWTIGSAKHYPNLDLIIGRWGDGAKPEHRQMVSLLFRPDDDVGQFMVIDSEPRLVDRRELCARALRRDEVVGTSIAKDAFEIVDAIWLQDPRVSEVKNLNSAAGSVL
jgi:hypothetical protein